MLCRFIINKRITAQPITYSFFFLTILITNEHSASENPLIQKGFSFSKDTAVIEYNILLNTKECLFILRVRFTLFVKPDLELESECNKRESLMYDAVKTTKT